MSTLSSVREIARAEAPPSPSAAPWRCWPVRSWSGSSIVMTRAELARSRRQLAQLDERLLRDIGLDRATARFEATKSFWA